MTYAQFIDYLKERLEYANQAAETDLNHAKTYAYDAVCKDIYHAGCKKRQAKAREAARFHDGRADGHNSCVWTITEILQKAESLEVDTIQVDKPIQST
jgi:hypothetical protein